MTCFRAGCDARATHKVPATSGAVIYTCDKHFDDAQRLAATGRL